MLKNIDTEKLLKVFHISGTVEEYLKHKKVKLAFTTTGLLAYSPEKKMDLKGLTFEVVQFYIINPKLDVKSEKHEEFLEYKAAIGSMLAFFGWDQESEKTGDTVNLEVNIPVVNEDAQAVPMTPGGKKKVDVGQWGVSPTMAVPPTDGIAKLMNEKPIPLTDATKLYQPVKSTSIDSKYFVVALTWDLKIAARIKASSVSVRAEGNISKYLSQLVDNGFVNHTVYASVHIDAPLQSQGHLQFKALAAAIFGLGVSFEQVAGNFNFLIGKGA